MLTLAHRHPRQRPWLSAQRGFTLIELMVVLVIIGIASATMGLSFSVDPNQKLRQDAQRLAQVLTVAQNEVRIDGRVIAWQADADGYRFARGVWQLDGVVPAVSTQAGLDTFTHDDTLRPRRWLTPPVRISPDRPIVLNDEWFQDPWQLTLSSTTGSVVLQRDTTGRIAVRQPSR